MGFDVYGIKPKMHKEKKYFKTLYKFDILDETEEAQENWALKFDMLKKAHKRTRDAYWKQHGEFQAVNPGVYFRNNVWWWRPLWDYVCKNVENITNEDWNNGHNNSGHEISEEKSKAIADYLDHAIHSGDIDKEENRIEMKNTEYPFNKENAKEFAIFCHDSGGFKIC